MRCWCSRRLASSWLTSSRTVIRLSLVISSETGWRGSLAKRTSRLVTMPTSRLLPFSTTGMPEMRKSAISLSASARVCSGLMVTGLTTMPDSNFLTLRTSSAWAAMSRFLWMTPMPPAWAMAMAILLSVTVSMAEDTSGMPSSMELVRRVRVSTSVGSTLDAAGVSSTSSKVRASRISMPTSGSRLALHNTDWPRDSNNYHRRAGPPDCCKINEIVTARPARPGAPRGVPAADLHQGRARVDGASWHVDMQNTAPLTARLP